MVASPPSDGTKAATAVSPSNAGKIEVRQIKPEVLLVCWIWRETLCMWADGMEGVRGGEDGDWLVEASVLEMEVNVQANSVCGHSFYYFSLSCNKLVT